MQQECPKCGCKLSSFDIYETQGCPGCAVHFAAEIQPISPKPAPLPQAAPQRGNQGRFPLGCLWVICLPCPGVVAAIIVMAKMSDASLRLGIWSGVVTSAVLSIVVASRCAGLARQAVAAVAFNFCTLLVSAFVFYAGCGLAIQHGH